MILQALVALMLLAQAAPASPPVSAPAPAPAPSPAAAAPAATPAPGVEIPLSDPAAFDLVVGEIDRLMEPWKGKSGDGLRGRLGLSTNVRPASDGEVVFWTERSQSMGCGNDRNGVLRCGSIDGGVCMLGVAFGKDGKVKSWRATGSTAACVSFARKLAPAS